MTPRTATPPPRPTALARFGPLAVVLASIALVAVLSSTGTDSVSTEETENEVGSAKSLLPIQYADAEAEGTLDDLDFGEGCDPDTGRVAIPSVYAPPCVAPRAGVEGGDTYQGVTADEIVVVLYEAAADDLAASLQDQSDPPEQILETREKLIEMYTNTFEMWGRKVRIVPLKGSGSDETSARADAVKVAAEIKAFASIGGPAQESAYALELARRKVVCISCGLSIPDATQQEYAPYLWGLGQTAEQFLLNLGDFLVERLSGQKAEFAGDPALQEKERVFGAVHFEQDPPVFGGVSDNAAADGAGRNYETSITLSYQLVIPELPEKARVLVARLKEAGVTSVIFLGDPVMPIYLTEAATDQDYFPEWIITGTVLTDTTVFGRLYDQRQWAHAFGVSSLSARLPQTQSDSWRLHEWYFGEPPLAKNTVAIVEPPIRTLMMGIHLAGPNLTPETFRDGLFAYPPSGGTPTAPRWSYGEQDFFPALDFNAVDDMQVVWWDVDETGLDEQGAEGTGMMRYADGGKRYLPGEMPSTPANVFEEEGSVVGYDVVPEAEAPPEYPSPAATTPGD